MKELLINYGLFLLKTLTLVFSFVFIISRLALLGQRMRKRTQVEVTEVNDRYQGMESELKKFTLSNEDWAFYQKNLLKSLKAKRKGKGLFKRKERKEKNIDGKEENSPRQKVFVLHFMGDIRASAVNQLRDEVTAILMVAAPQDEVLLILESPGGMVPHYGLAASQLKRIKDKNIALTVAVDKVAASGGYLMACIADKILAAPFAILGSIGVLAQIPNVHRLLKKHDVDFEQITAGEYKRTLTIFGENTEKAKIKLKEEIEDLHGIFKEFVSRERPQLDIQKVATGEHWFGIRALDLRLIDEIKTSDDYLMEAYQRKAQILEVHVQERKKMWKNHLSPFTESTQLLMALLASLRKLFKRSRF